MKRKGVVQLSFGMIFSILMIIAIIGVATYAIVYFVNIGEATELGLFHQKFQDTVDDVWSSSITDNAFDFSLPKGIELVCFGNLTMQSWNPEYEDEYNEFIRYSSNFDKRNTNRFIYPIDKAGGFAYSLVDKVDLSELHQGFDCFEVNNRRIEVRLVKDTFDASVTLRKV